METFLETIRTAVADGATAAQKQAGAAACRAVLTALDAPVGQPLALLPGAPAAPPRPGLDQVLDLIIARLQSMTPTTAAQAAAAPPRLTIPLVTAPGVRP